MAEIHEKVARGIFYSFTRIILFVVAVLIVALGFFSGMNSMNVNVIAKTRLQSASRLPWNPNAQ